MPGSRIVLGAAELAESRAVSAKHVAEAAYCATRAYKIPQNRGGSLHSLGVFLELLRDQGALNSMTGTPARSMRSSHLLNGVPSGSQLKTRL